MFSLRPVLVDDSGRVDQRFYGVFSRWYRARGGNAPTREMLPACGVIVGHPDDPCAAAFLYLDATGSGVALLSWMATRHDLPPAIAHQAVLQAVLYLADHARSLDYWTLLAVYACPSLIRQLSAAGFRTMETGAATLYLTL